jgi:hypothetical protein
MGHVMVFLISNSRSKWIGYFVGNMGAIGYFVCHVIEVDSNFNILLMFRKIGCLIFKCN